MWFCEPEEFETDAGSSIGICNQVIKAARHCPGWTEFLLGSFARGCGECGGLRSRSMSGLKRVEDFVFPDYQLTIVEELEQRREHLRLALAGQLLVVSLRVITGDFAGGFMGMVLFIFGNRARCSLQNCTLSGYIVTGVLLCALDSVFLLGRLWSLGSQFFLLPWADHLATDLSAISTLLAPAVEFYGPRQAWDSFLNPSMLMHTTTLRLGGRAQACHVNCRCPDCQQGLAVHRSNSAAAASVWSFSAPNSIQPSAPNLGDLQIDAHHESPALSPAPSSSLASWAAAGLGYSSAGTAITRAGTFAGTGSADEDRCAECGRHVRSSSEGRCSRGNGSGRLYCRTCWASWTRR